jgi:hypothetical protein
VRAAELERGGDGAPAPEREREAAAVGEWPGLIAAMWKMSPAAVEAFIECLDRQQLIALRRAVVATMEAGPPPDDGPGAA